MKRNMLSLFLLTSAIFSASCSTNAENVIKNMSGKELDSIILDDAETVKYLIIDVREDSEYSAGHVAHAINISVKEIENRLNELSDFKEKNIVVLCRSGKRSRVAAEILVKNGFKKVFNADGVSSYNYQTLTKIKNVLGGKMQEMAESAKFHIIDARAEKDYNDGHLKGAFNIESSSLDAKLDSLPKDKPIAVYSYTGNKSFIFAQKLSDAGFAVFNSINGTKEYTKYKFVK